MQPEPHRQQSNSQPISTFLQSATYKEAATEAEDAVNEDTGIEVGDKAYKEEKKMLKPLLNKSLIIYDT